MVARVLWVIARELLCDNKGVVNVVAKVLYGCHIVARVLWVVARELLCDNKGVVNVIARALLCGC